MSNGVYRPCCTGFDDAQIMKLRQATGCCRSLCTPWLDYEAGQRFRYRLETVARCRDDGIAVQIAGHRFSRLDQNGFIGLCDVKCVHLDLRMNRHAGKVEFLACADNATGNLAPVRDEHLFHDISIRGTVAKPADLAMAFAGI
jgi:hypothetical protein